MSSHQHGTTLVVEQPGYDPEGVTDALIWRQSLVHDIYRCPRMAALDWVYNFSAITNDAKRGFIAAVFGTAAHKVIQDYNEADHEMDYAELLGSFESECDSEYAKAQETIPIKRGCETFREAMDSVGAEYMHYITAHLAYEQTRKDKLTVTGSEQQFVMPVIYRDESYLFYGTIDQMCADEDGLTVVRDFKFRDAAFKPTWRQLQIDPQMIIYSAALRWGVPACDKCKPTYTGEDYFQRKIVYGGTCDSCAAKIGTYQWPGVYPNRGELIWMKDFKILKRSTAYRKKGDVAGKAVYDFKFNSVNVEKYMLDILQNCHAFRHGFHPRRYGEACKFWCTHAESCVKELHSVDSEV